MAKTVFGSHANLAHVWAAQSAPHGRAGDGRMSFDGASIYSYGHHYTIARFVTNAKGERAVLFNADGYSTSTGKHRSHVWSALHGLNVRVFEVPNPERDPSVATVTAMAQALYLSVDKLKRSFPYSVDDVLTGLENEAQEIRDLAKFFGLNINVLAPTLTAEELAKLRERSAKKAEREAAKAEKRRADHEAADARRRAKFLEGGEHHLYEQHEWGIGSTFTEEERAQHLAAYDIIQRDKLTAWRAGKPVHWDWSERDTVPTMMRVQGDVIQTSRGAEFPVRHGIMAFAVIAYCHKTGSVWERDGKTIHLGNFRIDRVDADGTVHAGCHTVAWPEIERVAKELGVI